VGKSKTNQVSRGIVESRQTSKSIERERKRERREQAKVKDDFLHHQLNDPSTNHPIHRPRALLFSTKPVLNHSTSPLFFLPQSSSATIFLLNTSKLKCFNPPPFPGEVVVVSGVLRPRGFSQECFRVHLLFFMSLRKGGIHHSMVVVSAVRSPGGLNCRCRLLLAIHHPSSSIVIFFILLSLLSPCAIFSLESSELDVAASAVFLLPLAPLMSSLPLPAPTEDGEESGIVTVVVVIGTCRGKM
jgi:hypothetical protein